MASRRRCELVAMAVVEHAKVWADFFSSKVGLRDVPSHTIIKCAVCKSSHRAKTDWDADGDGKNNNIRSASGRKCLR